MGDASKFIGVSLLLAGLGVGGYYGWKEYRERVTYGYVHFLCSPTTGILTLTDGTVIHSDSTTRFACQRTGTIYSGTVSATDCESQTVNFTIRPNVTTELVVTLNQIDPTGTYVDLTYSPSTANVTIDNIKKDPGKYAITPAVSHHWAADATGFVPDQGDFTVSQGTTYPLQINLQPDNPVSGYFGYQSGDLVWSEGPNRLDAAQVTNNAGSGSVTQLEIKVPSAPSGGVMLALYTDTAGAPGSLLGGGVGSYSSGWVKVTGLSISVTLNTKYWIIVLLQSQTSLNYTETTNRTHYIYTNTPTQYGTFPATWPGTTDTGYTPYVCRALIGEPLPDGTIAFTVGPAEAVAAGVSVYVDGSKIN